MRGRYGFGFGGRFSRGFGCESPRMRRGDMKFLLLEILKEGPRHGYEIINGLEGQTKGYRPSPGSVYPTLQMLEEGGCVTSQQIDGKKVYTITAEGLKLLEERGKTTPFEETPGMRQAFEIRKSLTKLGIAVIDGGRGTDPETMKKIEDVLNQARREVYSILAES